MQTIYAYTGSYYTKQDPSIKEHRILFKEPIYVCDQLVFYHDFIKKSKMP